MARLERRSRTIPASSREENIRTSRTGTGTMQCDSTLPWRGIRDRKKNKWLNCGRKGTDGFHVCGIQMGTRQGDRQAAAPPWFASQIPAPPALTGFTHAAGLQHMHASLRNWACSVFLPCALFGQQCTAPRSAGAASSPGPSPFLASDVRFDRISVVLLSNLGHV